MSEEAKTNLQSMVHFSSVLLILKNELLHKDQISLECRKSILEKISPLFPKELTKDLVVDEQGMVHWSVDNSSVVLSIVGQ